MSSREKILEDVLAHQPQTALLPDISMFKGSEQDPVQKYVDVFTSIGGAASLVDDLEAVKTFIRQHDNITRRIVTTFPGLGDTAELLAAAADPHSLQDVELAVIQGHFAVAENGAVWFTERVMGQRILPYICQHLAVVVQAEDIVPTLHEAYERMDSEYGFGGFIAGPSKTADIEQALVLGAHGPLSMTVFVMR